MYVQAGAGIVADSDPKSEQQECINKARALFRAAEEARRFARRGPAETMTKLVVASAQHPCRRRLGP